MSAVSLNSEPTKIVVLRRKEAYLELDKTIEKVIHVTVSYFRSGALYILPLVTKLTGSKRLAQSIINGAFSGLVLDISFSILGLPKNNLALNCLSGYLFRSYFNLFEEL